MFLELSLRLTVDMFYSYSDSRENSKCIFPGASLASVDQADWGTGGVSQCVLEVRVTQSCSPPLVVKDVERTSGVALQTREPP